MHRKQQIHFQILLRPWGIHKHTHKSCSSCTRKFEETPDTLPHFASNHEAFIRLTHPQFLLHMPKKQRVYFHILPFTMMHLWDEHTHNSCSSSNKKTSCTPWHIAFMLRHVCDTHICNACSSCTGELQASFWHDAFIHERHLCDTHICNVCKETAGTLTHLAFNHDRHTCDTHIWNACSSCTGKQQATFGHHCLHPKPTGICLLYIHTYYPFFSCSGKKLAGKLRCIAFIKQHTYMLDIHTKSMSMLILWYPCWFRLLSIPRKGPRGNL